MVSGMTPWTLTSIAEALRSAWAVDTCSPDDIARAGWSPDNPAWGHCDIAALIINDLFGGDFLLAEVHLDGEQHGYHSWNRLGTGLEIDVTREQFRLGQVITAPRLVKRPEVALPQRWKEYQLLRERLASRLGPLPPPAEGALRH